MQAYAWILATLAVGVLFTSPLASAGPAAPEPSSSTPPAGTLHFTDKLSRSSGGLGGTFPFHEMSLDPPATPKKVHFPRSLGPLGLAHSFGFEWKANWSYDISGEVRLRAFIGCDYPVVFSKLDAAGYGAFRVSLYTSEEAQLGAGWMNPAQLTCQPGDVIELVGRFPIADHRLERMDNLGLEFIPHVTNFLGAGDPQPGLYVIVGNRERASGLTIGGLPVPAGPVDSAKNATATEEATANAARSPGPGTLISAVAAALSLMLVRRVRRASPGP